MSDGRTTASMSLGGPGPPRCAGPRRSGPGPPPGPLRECPSMSLMTCMGRSAPRSRTKSKPPLPTRGSRTAAQYSRIRVSRTDTRRAVNTRAISRRWRLWSGGSSKMNMPLGHGHPGPDDLEDRSPFRAEGLPVDRARFDVGEAADGVEVEVVVVIERRLVAQTARRRDRGRRRCRSRRGRNRRRSSRGPRPRSCPLRRGPASPGRGPGPGALYAAMAA